MQKETLNLQQRHEQLCPWLRTGNLSHSFSSRRVKESCGLPKSGYTSPLSGTAASIPNPIYTDTNISLTSQGAPMDFWCNAQSTWMRWANDSHLFSSPKHRPFIPWCYSCIAQPCAEIWVPDSQRQHRRCEFGGSHRETQQRRASGDYTQNPVHYTSIERKNNMAANFWQIAGKSNKKSWRRLCLLLMRPPPYYYSLNFLGPGITRSRGEVPCACSACTVGTISA